jgi:hypothetical protein
VLLPSVVHICVLLDDVPKIHNKDTKLYTKTAGKNVKV